MEPNPTVFLLRPNMAPQLVAKLANRLPAPETLVSFLMSVLPWISVAHEIAVVIPLAKGKFQDTEHDDVVLRLWCDFRRLDVPSSRGFPSPSH